MSELLGIAASAAGGGVFGILGTVAGRVAGVFEKRQELAHERARWQHEIELRQFELEADLKAAEAELVKAEVEGTWKGLEKSLEAEAAIGESYKWVNAVRSLTRPTLTLSLWFITAGIYFSASAQDQSSIINAATFAATAATLWWFGDRAPSLGGRKTL